VRNFGELALPISIFHSDNATAIVAGLIGGVHRAPPAVWRAENSAGFLYPFVEPTEHTGHGRGLSPAAITPAPLHHGHSSPS